MIVMSFRGIYAHMILLAIMGISALMVLVEFASFPFKRTNFDEVKKPKK